MSLFSIPLSIKLTWVEDKLPEAAAPLTDLAIDSMGGWTMMNPIYTEAELDTVKVVNRAPVTLSDKAAHGVVKLLR